MDSNNFFWLHIKKCGGQSFRKTFSPPYVQTDRLVNYKTFIALPKEEWNDALNNYRIPLGEYDYKRMQFAKKFLYNDDEFNNMVKFVIVRNPFDRAVSTWKYLFNRPKNPMSHLKPNMIRMKYSFPYFLESLPKLWESKSDRHMATHTAPIWPDITDENENLLVDKIIKLEEMDREISWLNDLLKAGDKEYEHINRRGHQNDYRKYYNKRSKRLVETMYEKDITGLGYEF